nr:DNA polymerase [synthetic construct]
MDFFNPYLGPRGPRPHSHRGTDAPAPAGAGAVQPPPDVCRLIPACLRTPGAGGMIPVTIPFPPTYFENGARGDVLLANERSMWTARDRKPVAPDPQDQSITFHAYDVVETTYAADRCAEVPSRFQTDIIPSGTVLKLLGRTEDGTSVCVNVFRQQVYFYAKVPAGINVTHILQQALKNTAGRAACGFSTRRVNKRILKTYDVAEHPVTEITLSSGSMLSTLSDRLVACGCEVFESNVDAVRRFVLDHGFTTFGWYSCARATPRLAARDARTALEFDCSWEDLSVQADRSDWPPYRIVAFDIECTGEAGFPCATRDGDAVIQISCVFYTTREGAPNPPNILFSVGTCDPIPDTDVLEFPSEYDMLVSFFAMIRDFEVDFLTGYNISNFDLPYLITRASQVYNLRLNEYTKIKTGSIFEVHEPRGGGGGFMRSVSKIKIAGIVPIDMYQVCREKLSLSDYKLDTVARQCLGGKKEDVSYKDIPPLFRSGPGGRAKVGSYCVMDSVLVMDLLKIFMIHVEISEIAKLAKIQARRVLTDGQQLRVFSCLLEAAARENFILPVPTPEGQGGYQGATVINPIPGFYDEPVLVVDFASLYPSIIQAHNLCYSTMIHGRDLHLHPNLTPDDYETFVLSGGPVHFVKKHKRESLLGRLLTVWLEKRRAIRRTLAACDDPSLKTILDKQQLAIKVTCNAVYGFTGVASGLLPCINIAETVTLRGRTMLEMSKSYVEALTTEDLRTRLGREVTARHGARFRVVYGDTDSLFIACDGYSAEAVSAFCDDLAARITADLFPPPIKLEAEKTFKCLLLLTKKRYIGVLLNDKMVMKGVDLIRKTACKFVQERCRAILDLVLHDPEVKAAARLLCKRPPHAVYEEGLPAGFIKIVEVLNASYLDLRNSVVPIEQLTFSTELSRPVCDYKTTNLPHLAVYQKLASRCEELPQVHDRIPYVFVDAPGSLKSDLAEHPDYVRQHQIPVAVDLYFDKLVHGAANILQCLFGNNADTTVAILYNFLNVPYKLFS